MARKYFDVTLRKRFNPFNETPFVIERVYAIYSREDDKGILRKSYETPNTIYTLRADEYDESITVRKYVLLQ